MVGVKCVKFSASPRLQKERNLLSIAALSLSRGCLSTLPAPTGASLAGNPSGRLCRSAPLSQRLALAKIFSLHRLHLFANCSNSQAAIYSVAFVALSHLHGIFSCFFSFPISNLQSRISFHKPLFFKNGTSSSTPKSARTSPCQSMVGALD